MIPTKDEIRKEAGAYAETWGAAEFLAAESGFIAGAEYISQNSGKPIVSGALLPSDEEITKALNAALKLKNADIDDSVKSVWIEGAQWMRDLMLGRQ